MLAALLRHGVAAGAARTGVSPRSATAIGGSHLLARDAAALVVRVPTKRPSA